MKDTSGVKRLEYVELSRYQWADTGIVPGGESFRTLKQFNCFADFSVDENQYEFPVLMGVFKATTTGRESRFIPIGFDRRGARLCLQMGGWYGPQPVISCLPFGVRVKFLQSFSCDRPREFPDMVKIVKYSGYATVNGNANGFATDFFDNDSCPLHRDGGFGVNISAGSSSRLTVGGCRMQDNVVRDKFSGRIYRIKFSFMRMDGSVEYHDLMPCSVDGDGALYDGGTGSVISFVGDPVGKGPEL